MIYAYARVSTKEQNLDRQLEELKKYTDKIYQEKQSGKDFESRIIYQKMKKKLSAGDLLIIASLDRLGRNYEQIISEWKDITNKGCDIQVLDMPILNTKNGVDGLDGKFISNLVLQILAYVSQKEREKIKERQKQGIRISKEKGVKFGRPSILDERLDFDEYYFKQDLKTMNWIRFCDKYGISRAIYFKYRKKFYPELVKSFKIKKKVVLEWFLKCDHW